MWLPKGVSMILAKLEGLSLVTDPDASATKKIKQAVPDAPIRLPQELGGG
jgi:hypothetical protein